MTYFVNIVNLQHCPEIETLLIQHLVFVWLYIIVKIVHEYTWMLALKKPS